MAVQISGNTAQFNKSMAEASKTVDKFGKDAKKASTDSNNFGKSLTGLSGPLKLLAGLGIGAGLVSLGKTIFDLGVKQEQLNIAFNTFLGSADKAKRLIGDLNEFAIVTPFSPDQVNSAAKALLAFGVSGEEIIPTLKQLGDVSAGTGKDLTEMAIIFGQIRSTGRLMGQDLLQLINAGFNPLQVISEKTGKSVVALKKEMEQGKITFQQVAEAFKIATSEGGLFFNLMEKQSESIGGLVSTIAGNIEEGFKNIFTQTQGPLKAFVDQLVKLSEAFREFTKGPDQKREETFQTILAQEIKAFENLVDIFDGDSKQALSVLEEQITQRKEIIKQLVFSLRDQLEDIPVGSTSSKDADLRKEEERLTNEFLAYDKLIPAIKAYLEEQEKANKKAADAALLSAKQAANLGLIQSIMDQISAEEAFRKGLINEDAIASSNLKLIELRKELERLQNLGKVDVKEIIKFEPPKDVDTGDIIFGPSIQEQFSLLKAALAEIGGAFQLAEGAATGAFQKIGEGITAVADKMVDVGGLIAGGIADIANAFGEAAVGGEDFGKSFIKALARFAQQFGSLLIATGLGQIALQSGNPALMIAGGAALIAAGAAINALMSNKPSLSGGGSGGRSGGGYSGSAFTRSGQEITVTGEVVIDGDNLRYILNRNDQKNSRTR